MSGPRTAEIAPEIIDSLESLVYAAVGLTSVALGDVAAADLTISQWRVLVVVGRSPGIRVGDIAARIGLSLPSTSRLVLRLERHGHVIAERDDTDRRATVVTLTAEGEHIREAVIARRRARLQAALADGTQTIPNDLARGLAALAGALDVYR